MPGGHRTTMPGGHLTTMPGGHLTIAANRQIMNQQMPIKTRQHRPVKRHRANHDRHRAPVSWRAALALKAGGNQDHQLPAIAHQIGHLQRASNPARGICVAKARGHLRDGLPIGRIIAKAPPHPIARRIYQMIIAA